MSVIPFPTPEDGMTEEQWHEGLLLLHERLSAALAKERKQINSIRMVLSIDDVMDLCQTIEATIGPEWFDDNIPA